LVSGNADTTALVWDLTGRRGAAGEPLGAGAVDACWADLAGADAARAYQALRKLAAVQAQARPYLGERVKPVPVADRQLLARLIAELGNDRFAVREYAATELDKLGEAAVAAYRELLESGPSLEVRRRVERLLEKRLDEWKDPSADR